MKNVDISKNFSINGVSYVRNKGRTIIGEYFRANSGKNKNPIGGDTVFRLIIQKGAILTIGDNVGISNSTIVCHNEITIGDNVKIGGSCKIWDTNFHSIDYKKRITTDDDIKTGKIIIGNNCFIGGDSTILKGVDIGKNSIIAAGSVVTKNIPENEIWGGNPARLIRKIFEQGQSA